MGLMPPPMRSLVRIQKIGSAEHEIYGGGEHVTPNCPFLSQTTAEYNRTEITQRKQCKHYRFFQLI